MTRTYTELQQFSDLASRFEYLKLDQRLGDTTFGSDRWINQLFYKSAEWQDIRSYVIARDQGMDLGSSDVPIMGAHLIHHMNPITVADIENSTDNLLDPEFLICCALRTHTAVHFGDNRSLPQPFVERTPGDTVPWRK